MAYFTQHSARHRRSRRWALALLVSILLTACGSASGSGSDGAAADIGAESSTDGVFLDASTIHEISVSFDQLDYAAMIETYSADGTKDWIAVDVTIDGTTYTNVGMRLKGNSSLRGLGSGRTGGPGEGVSADEPESLPWLIRLDKFVDGQNHQGTYDLVVRSNNSQTALNEAVALELLEAAGLASQDAAYAAFTVNGSEAVLRLVVENPDDMWLEDAFAASGVLYKAEATGDYSYRGDDPDAYDEVFDIEAGEDNGDLTPLIEFLDFINNADDETFNRELADRLDIDGFATYLAAQELIDNFDDIDGPGNNSYLYYDTETGSFTVVPWDHNLAFGGLGVGGGAGGFARPDGFEQMPGGSRDGTADLGAPGPSDGRPPDGPGFGGAPGGSNILVERFLANEDWQALYETKLAELWDSLYDGGSAAAILAEWVEVLGTQDLVEPDVVEQEAATVGTYFG